MLLVTASNALRIESLSLESDAILRRGEQHVSGPVIHRISNPRSMIQRPSFELSVGGTSPSDLLETEGLFTTGLRPGRIVNESVGGILEMDSADWSNGIRYHVVDTRSDTEFNVAICPALVRGIFQSVLAVSTQVDKLCKAEYKRWVMQKTGLPFELDARGFDGSEMLPEYPYRDDGVAWQMLHASSSAHALFSTSSTAGFVALVPNPYPPSSCSPFLVFPPRL